MFSNHLLVNDLVFTDEVAVSHIHLTIGLRAKCRKCIVICLYKKNTYAKSYQKYPNPALCTYFDTEITMWSFRNIRYTSTNFLLQANPVLSQFPFWGKGMTSHPVSKARNLGHIPGTSLSLPSHHPYLIHHHRLTVFYLHSSGTSSSPTQQQQPWLPASALPLFTLQTVFHTATRGIFPKQIASYHSLV